MNIDQNNIEQKKLLDKEFSPQIFMIKIVEFLLFLKSKALILFFSMILGGLIGLIADLIIKPNYKAKLTFAMEEDKGSGSGLSGALGLASSFGIDLGSSGGGGAFATSNISELMKSRLIIEKVLLEPMFIRGKKTSLINYYIEINALKKNIAKKETLKYLDFPLNLERNKFSLQQDSVLKVIYKKLINKDNLNIMQKDKKVTILTIEVESNDEIFAKIFCESLARETSDLYIETKSKKARLNVNVLQHQVDSVRDELNSAITGVASETDFVYNLNPALNIKGAPSKKRQIDVQANTAILTNLVVQLELAKITLRKETPLIQLIDKPILPLDDDELGTIMVLLLGFLIGLLIVIFFYIYLKYLKNVFWII